MSKKKVQDYLVVIKNPNAKMIERTGWLMSLLALLILVIQLFMFPKSWGLFLCLFIILVLLISNAIEKRKKKPIRFGYVLIAAGIGLTFFGDGPNSNLLFIVLGILEKFLLQKKEIGFAKDGITIGNIFPQKSPWSEIDNIVLKGGMLTIDFKNNKLIQLETDDEEDDEYDVEDEEFNNYCRTLLGN
ncbi:MAG: hypothetical protein RLZZ595_966 [Bacteroidota bacterium]|jgi:hypothetical protein